MANDKCRKVNKIITSKQLDIDFKAITFTTFGGFGEGTHELIKEVTKDRRTPTGASTTPGSNLTPSPTHTLPLVSRWQVRMHWYIKKTHKYTAQSSPMLLSYM